MAFLNFLFLVDLNFDNRLLPCSPFNSDEDVLLVTTVEFSLRTFNSRKIC